MTAAQTEGTRGTGDPGAAGVTGAGVTAPAAIEARGWGWRYATRQAWAVRDASFRIAPGERVLLLGASGAGKSTLLQGIAGILGGADEGEHEGELLVASDARRKEVYWARYAVGPDGVTRLDRTEPTLNTAIAGDPPKLPTGLDPDAVADRIVEFHNAGIETFMLQFQPFEAEMERFAGEVIPRVRERIGSAELQVSAS